MAPVPILTVQAHDKRGGPSVQHISFLEAIDRSRFSMHALIVPSHEMHEQYAKCAASVLTIPQMPTMPRSKSPLALGRYLRQTKSIAREIVEAANRVDARIIHSFSEAFPAPLLAAQHLGLPSIVHILGMNIFQPAWVGKIWIRFYLDRAARIIGCQRKIGELVGCMGVDPQKIRVVYNCIDSQAVRERAQADPPVTLQDERLKVGMVAQMDRRKGHLNFVEAAALVCQQRPDVSFYCMGDTSGDETYLSEIRARIKHGRLSDQFRLVGRVDNMGAWIQAMDLFCIPSLSEALSVAGLEAMALAKPIVATRVGGNPEGVADGENGFICEPDDPEDLAAKLLILLGDEKLRTDFGQNGQRRVDELFGTQGNTTVLQSVFDELLQ